MDERNRFNKKWLSDCLKEMANQNLIFRSEEQFQFCLAWAIQDFFGSYNVLLEELTLNIDYSGKNKRSYTDILVDKGNNEFIAIELKYKTADANIGGVSLLNHGAADLGRFDYLWDINRLERLVYPLSVKRTKENGLINMANGYGDNELPIITDYIYDKRIEGEKIIKGFAIILTNEEKYWTYSKNSLSIKPCVYCNTAAYHDFCIAEGDESNNNNYSGTKIQDWGKVSGNYITSVCGKWRGRPLEFIGDYQFDREIYKDFDVGKNKTFKFCITEIKKIRILLRGCRIVLHPRKKMKRLFFIFGNFT